ncbi:hypothetical protein VKT23_014927 [Stygiomarasmius scandens]|uniref:Uncharacterized protein n=1 Tax=Marasmiellus scandens TaxID=2682957 RepID=A0ABR1J256_9AGAR
MIEVRLCLDEEEQRILSQRQSGIEREYRERTRHIGGFQTRPSTDIVVSDTSVEFGTGYSEPTVAPPAVSEQSGPPSSVQRYHDRLLHHTGSKSTITSSTSMQTLKPSSGTNTVGWAGPGATSASTGTYPYANPSQNYGNNPVPFPTQYGSTSTYSQGSVYPAAYSNQGQISNYGMTQAQPRSPAYSMTGYPNQSMVNLGPPQSRSGYSQSTYPQSNANIGTSPYSGQSTLATSRYPQSMVNLNNPSYSTVDEGSASYDEEQPGHGRSQRKKEKRRTKGSNRRQ